ncbi:NAD(+) diphosphatase [Marivita geojedonensis]|uniref:NAD(+) diphosphatase n=1 Tax=Marivita geojedonensis TaxID=1123756 RepID=A0A1X4NIE1_9RHOB|nr:NAD(+) diphosphatase [Marivita geojedonensis]OSQ48228.1 NUDIX hydrolase [Marivita geojedonensis]PRY74901.1 NAD+ diphosphatase [Marivita geojedonensis]
MRTAEQVTFGGSALDRAAELRGDVPALAAVLQDPATRTIVLWKGKPLLTGEGSERSLVRLPLDHPILKEARESPILLGREDGAARFAHDISAWVPDEDISEVGAFIDRSEQRHPTLPDDHGFAELRSVMTALSPRDAELAATAKAILGWHETHGFCARCGAQSDVTQAGWQRVCQACGASHFPRTDPVVIMLITHGNKVLLGRSPGWPEGMYSCLAGFVEPGETIEAAVRREVWEEAGVRVGEVRYLSSQPWPFPASLMFGCQGIALSDDINIDPVEIEDALWASREDVMDALAGLRQGLLPARKGAIAHFLLRNWLADTLD